MSEKLDRLVATRVMNWQTHARNTAWWVDADVETGFVPSGGVRGLTCGMDRWSPSTSIKTAWEVESKMRERKRFITLERDPASELFECVFVDYCRGYGDYKLPPRAYHKSAPMAICLAALRAVGVSESEIQEAMR